MPTIIFFTFLGMALGGLLAWVVTYFGMLDEIDRLKNGDFTPEELQNLCHNLTSCDYKEFCDGCTAYQRKLFNGHSREDDLL